MENDDALCDMDVVKKINLISQNCILSDEQ